MTSFETRVIKPRTQDFASNYHFFLGGSSSCEGIILNSLQFFSQASAKIIPQLHPQLYVEKSKACQDEDQTLISPAKNDLFYLGAYWIGESEDEILCTENQLYLPWTTFLPWNKQMAAARGCSHSSWAEQVAQVPTQVPCSSVKHEHRHSLQCAVRGFSFSAPLIRRQVGITSTLKGCGSIYPLFPVSFKQAFSIWWWICYYMCPVLARAHLWWCLVGSLEQY